MKKKKPLPMDEVEKALADWREREADRLLGGSWSISEVAFRAGAKWGLKAGTLHGAIVADIPQLKRGRVWCYECGATTQVDSAACLRSGWPTCCGSTMGIDSPKERRAIARARAARGEGK